MAMLVPKSDKQMKPDHVVERFCQQEPRIHGQKTHHVACDLLTGILSHHRFATVDDLIAFCREPENLRDWLTNEAERILMAHELERGLTEILSDAA